MEPMPEVIFLDSFSMIMPHHFLIKKNPNDLVVNLFYGTLSIER